MTENESLVRESNLQPSWNVGEKSHEKLRPAVEDNNQFSSNQDITVGY